MEKFTFLTNEQYFEDEKLDILKKRGVKAAITDFSILLGGMFSNSDHIESDSYLEGRTGVYWTKSDDGDNDARAVDYSGTSNGYRVIGRNVGARPALPFSSISSIPTNGESGKRAADGILEVKYGYYPQKAASKKMQINLENEYKKGTISQTGNSYTTDSIKYDDYDVSYEPQDHIEYEYNGKRYIRVKANSCYGKCTLSNGEEYNNGDYIWIEVEPIKWIVDEKAKIMLSDKIIFAGVQFNEKRNYKTKNFDKTNIKKYMDETFARDIENVKKIRSLEEQPENLEQNKRRKSRLEKLNPDETNYNDRTKMTDAEIIHNWIESGESVLLRGPSGIGKTERIKSLYPDLIYMKLTNNMFPEKVVGSTNLQTGQDIPPNFAKTAIMQGATEEEKKLIEENIQNIYKIADTVYERSKTSDKKVVILLDELLNVKPTVQSLVYTLVLNKIVEIGNGLKLPDNVVVVATGNQKKYSNVSEDLAKPLEKRFDHILDMKPKVGEWIIDYAIPNKIHPMVIGYILTKYLSNGKSEDIDNMGYFYEEPEIGEQNEDENGCEGRTNDPRGWASISNSLYNFERNLEAGKYKGKDVEDIIKRSIHSKLRFEWAEEFFDYYNLPTLTPKEVVEGIGKGYTEEDLPKNINDRYAYMMALITANDSEVAECREFIRKYCDSEYLSIYDIYWVGNDKRRMEKISELQELSASHNIQETEVYAQDGVSSYTKIGQMYNTFLTKDKESVRGE